MRNLWFPLKATSKFSFSTVLSTYRIKINFSSILNNKKPTVNKVKKNPIMKVLNVAEKNDAAKNIANLLSRNNFSRREGLSKFNKIYEFKMQLWNQNCDMVMTSLSGHLLSFDFPNQYRNWRSCNPVELFDAPVIKTCPQDYEKIKKTLEREIRHCAALIIWTDCDREGENIGFEIISVCRQVKPNINVYRARFSEITQASVYRAVTNLEAPNQNISDAVDVRSELDLRIGAAFTRFQTLRLTRIFPAVLTDHILSYGPCQFPTLGFVVERFNAIENFQSEPYWKIRVIDERDNLAVEFRWARHRLFEELPCQVILDICQENPQAKVEKITSKPKSKWRPLPLDTIELEKQGSRKLRLNAKETMRVAEKLYSQGYISYPRTETNIFPNSMNLRPLVENQTQNPRWGEFAQRVLNEGPNPRRGKKSDEAHPPIHPLKYPENLDSLAANEKAVYEYVVRHFLACLSKDAEGHETIVEIDVAGEKFTANGLQILAKNYLEVFIYDKWNSKEIHMYELGQLFTPSLIDMVQESTSPPSLLTEADLIALMDKHGIGTDATHAEHIEKIKTREYAGLQDNKYIMPGKLGIGLVTGYDDMGFQMSKPHLRAELERDLKLICEGQKTKDEVLQVQIDKYRQVFREAVNKVNFLDQAVGRFLGTGPEQITEVIENGELGPRLEQPILKCPKCGLDMTLKNKRQGTGLYIGCQGYPTCKNAVWFPDTVEGAQVLDENCNDCRAAKQITFKLRQNAFPTFGSRYTTCIAGCDEFFNESIGINLGTVRRTQSLTNDSGFSSFNTTHSSSNRTTNANANANVRIADTSHSNSFQRIADSYNTTNAPRNVANTSNIQRNTSQNRSDWISDNSWNDSGNRSASSGNTSNNFHSPTNDGNDVVCQCHEPAILLTVKKTGPNTGRKFYKCAKPIGGCCPFFLWAPNDDTNTNTTDSNNWNAPSSSNSRPQTHQRQNNDGNNWDAASTSWNDGTQELKCNCGSVAKKLTVYKEGPNKGRQFYTCPKGIGNGCKFFKWADDTDAGSSFGGGGGDNWGPPPPRPPSNRGRGRGSGNSASKQPSSSGGTGKRKCSNCRTEGHTRNKCPALTMS